MAWDLEVVLSDRPGTLATLGEALGAAGINIDGISGSAGPGAATIHLLVDDAGAAQRVLQSAGIEAVGSTEVVIASFKDQPGELGTMARRIADTGTNIALVYITCDGRIVFGTDNNAAASKALGV
ncbi:MAG TPA: ACT domain-containing protein [Acidimicrobiia bacterium]|nr:ACT domain-containing protein [Acidimicrobiia bacterium]